MGSWYLILSSSAMLRAAVIEDIFGSPYESKTVPASCRYILPEYNSEMKEAKCD